MILAAVDTSHARGSLVVASYDKSEWKILTESAWDKKAMHSEVATLEFEKAMRHAGLDLAQLTHLAVNHGPGSFTGLRVGMNLTRTLAYVFNLPIATISTLEILAARDGDGPTLVATKAVQNFFYVAAYDGDQEILAPRSMEEDGLRNSAKNMTKVLIESLTPGFNASTEARDMLPILGQMSGKTRFFSWPDAKPLYVRASEAEEKLKRGLLKPI